MKNNQVCFRIGIMMYCFLAIILDSNAQKKMSVDNGYYITYPDKLAVRLFLSQKFAPFTLSSSINKEELNYKTNSKLILGIGATYKSVTLNLGYGFSFLNKDKGGKTKGLDLQLHIYPDKWGIDLLGSFRKGYYLDPKDVNGGLNLATYYQRPDLKRDIVGLSVFRVPNSNKFSYRAAITQNDWQTKSAGSLLYGGEAYYGLVEGDSALVPAKVSSNFGQAGVNKINFFSIGPGIGYAYTLVIKRFFFITGSAVATLDFNYSSEDGTNGKHSKISVLPGSIYKAAIGYNSSKYSVSANVLGNAIYAGVPSSSKKYFLPTGNIRLTLTKKIGLK
ncbi:MAG: DUF4421 family protein [Chitinophagaceae bacterium]|nr:DUF4421 family protein [Chitinophagaceae bacterium]